MNTILMNEITSNYTEHLNDVIPNVYNRLEFPDFMQLNYTPWIFGDSFRYLLSQCSVSQSSYQQDKDLYHPNIISGQIEVTVYKNNSIVTLIDYCLDVQFAIDIYVDGNEQLPSWITVDQLARHMTIIYENITKLGLFKIDIYALSLLLPNSQKYSSSFNLTLKNEQPEIVDVSTNSVFIIDKFNSFSITLFDFEKDNIQYVIKCKQGLFTQNSTFTKNVFTLIWTPSEIEIGNYDFEFTYFDQLHKNQTLTYDFQIIVSRYLPPYFEGGFDPLNIAHCTETKFKFPQPKIDNNNDFKPEFSIYIDLSTDKKLESWIYFDSSELKFNPKSDQLLITKISLNVKLIENISETYSTYILNVTLKENNISEIFKEVPNYKIIYPNVLLINLNEFSLMKLDSINLSCSVDPFHSANIVEIKTQRDIGFIKTNSNNDVVLSWILIGTNGWTQNFTSNQFEVNCPTTTSSFLIKYYGWSGYVCRTNIKVGWNSKRFICSRI